MLSPVHVVSFIMSPAHLFPVILYLPLCLPSSLHFVYHRPRSLCPIIIPSCCLPSTCFALLSCFSSSLHLVSHPCILQHFVSYPCHLVPYYFSFCPPSCCRYPRVFFFLPTAKLAMGSLAQKNSGAIRCGCKPRFRRRFRRAPESSRGFRCRKLMRFQRVPVQKADEVPDGSGADG